MHKAKMISVAIVSSVLLVACVAVAMISTNAGEVLAAKGPPALKYGATVTLKNVYNEYLVVNPDGTAKGGAYWGKNHEFKVIKAKGGKGAVKYADKVALMGQNGKYLLTTYSGKVVCRASVIAQDSVFQIDGGSGPVMLGDVVMFKSEYGFLHAQPGGATAMDMTPNTLAKFTLGMPGQENGLREARGLMYGDVVKFKNTDGDYLLLNRNGWFQLQGNGADPMENCVILSMQHREGHISYGDPIMLRGHNGRFITTSLDGRLEAVSRAWTDFAQFKFYGTLGSSSGYVHSRDEVMLKGARGFVDSVSNGGAEHVTADGTDRANSKWIVQKVWTSKI